MAWTQTDVDNFRSALAAARGALSIRFGDQQITFHSLTEQRAFLADMERGVAQVAETHQSYRLAATSKGV